MAERGANREGVATRLFAFVRSVVLLGIIAVGVPALLLWGLGLAIPVVELLAGALLIIGWRTREALITIGFVLLIVTYGHVLTEPLYSIKDHILPRGLLMFIALVLPSEADKLTLDCWLAKRAASYRLT